MINATSALTYNIVGHLKTVTILSMVRCHHATPHHTPHTRRETVPLSLLPCTPERHAVAVAISLPTFNF
jgi:hypothetical protein